MASAGWAELQYPKRHVKRTSVKNSYADYVKHRYHGNYSKCWSSASSWSVEDEEVEFCYSDISETFQGCDERYEESGGNCLPNNTLSDSDERHQESGGTLLPNDTFFDS